MGRLFKFRTGQRDDYRGDDFSLRIEQGFREIVTVVLARNGTTRRLEGERIGKRWQGIGIVLPPEVDATDVPQVVADLETGFRALRYSYVISRIVAVETVSEAEQQAAITELNEMGFDVERPEGTLHATKAGHTWTRVDLIPRSGNQRRDAKTAKELSPRIMRSVQSLGGRRPQMEVLAKSEDFA